jgi:hypothetical protein
MATERPNMMRYYLNNALVLLALALAELFLDWMKVEGTAFVTFFVVGAPFLCFFACSYRWLPKASIWRAVLALGSAILWTIATICPGIWATWTILGFHFHYGLPVRR